LISIIPIVPDLIQQREYSISPVVSPREVVEIQVDQVEDVIRAAEACEIGSLVDLDRRNAVA
jgi:hypothetical protein